MVDVSQMLPVVSGLVTQSDCVTDMLAKPSRQALIIDISIVTDTTTTDPDIDPLIVWQVNRDGIMPSNVKCSASCPSCLLL